MKGAQTPDAAPRRLLLVVTSAARFAATGQPTGVWLEEAATPYALFRGRGYDVTVASPEGGAAPIDPRSNSPRPEQGREWAEALRALRATVPLSRVRAGDHTAVFIAGGHGAMFDLPGHPALGRLLTEFARRRRPIAAVCHGPAAFVGAVGADGRPLVAGRALTAFTDAEERAVGLERAVPFLLETRLRALGGRFASGPAFAPFVRTDGPLITGQNPASSGATARGLLDALR